MDEKSDAWLVGRASELLAITQTATHGAQVQHVSELDHMLAEAQHRGEPLTITRGTPIEWPEEGEYGHLGIVDRFDVIGHH
ncbi:hypothetical protein ACFQ1S_28395, partial [Kibdelosporangium lantanae]